MQTYMKNYLFITLILTSIIGYSQCENLITVQNGSQLVNATTVTVTTTGFTSYYLGFSCPPWTMPYVIGYTGNGPQGDGEYLFTFSPSIDAATLNFIGINWFNSQNYEEIELLVDGKHYNIQSTGTILYCGDDPNPFGTLPIITPSGNLSDMPNDGSNYSACQNLTISGDISSLGIKIHMVGSALGAGFSLRICDTDLSLINYNARPISLFPNPSSQHSILQLSTGVHNAQIKIIDVYGQVVKTINNLSGDNFLIDYEGLSAGIYLLEVSDKALGILRTKAIID